MHSNTFYVADICEIVAQICINLKTGHLEFASNTDSINILHYRVWESLEFEKQTTVCESNYVNQKEHDDFVVYNKTQNAEIINQNISLVCAWGTFPFILQTFLLNASTINHCYWAHRKYVIFFVAKKLFLSSA